MKVPGDYNTKTREMSPSINHKLVCYLMPGFPVSFRNGTDNIMSMYEQRSMPFTYPSPPKRVSKPTDTALTTRLSHLGLSQLRYE